MAGPGPYSGTSTLALNRGERHSIFCLYSTRVAASMEEPAVPDLNKMYDIQDTASYILNRCYNRVALQFPDQLLKVSVAITSALRTELRRQSLALDSQILQSDSIQLYVLADTTYGSCCADEIAAAHVNAQCIVHYGHTCLSQMSRLPVWYVFGRAMIDAEDCVQQVLDYASNSKKTLLVLYDLEYAYAIPRIKNKTCETEAVLFGDYVEIMFAEPPLRGMDPHSITDNTEQDSLNSGVACGKTGNRVCCGESIDSVSACERLENNACYVDKYMSKEQAETQEVVEGSTTCPCKGKHQQEASQLDRTSRKSSGARSHEYSLGGLRWGLPANHRMEDLVIIWIGQDGPALTNIMLTYNSTAVVRYDPGIRFLFTDVANQSKILRRRYYLVERAKDANIVGIVIATLGVAGYQDVVSQIKGLVKAAGKKSYTLAMGKPSPSKLANFPECDIFVLVACAQTALLNSKDFMAPVITPFEAVLALTRESQWTGSYHLDFRVLKDFSVGIKSVQKKTGSVHPAGHKEARFSFLKGGYIEDDHTEESDPTQDVSSRALLLSRTTEQALQLQSNERSELATKMEAKSGVEYFAARSYHGLEIDRSIPIQHHLLGRKGRASVYNDEEEGKEAC